jgi:two-component system, chemotaxis family, sensor kinase Cph1
MIERPEIPHYDLSNCDAEPIHTPASIQPHGVLMVLTEPDLLVWQISDNTESVLQKRPADILGKPLESVLGNAQTLAVREQLSTPDPRLHSPIALSVLDEKQHLSNIALDNSAAQSAVHLDAILHRNGDGHLILELEPRRENPPQTDTFRKMRLMLSALQSTKSVRELCQTAVEEIRKVTGFDRVMAYRFDADWNGEVIAEARSEAIEPFLGLYYPASDIPKQARALYLLNPIRLIADVNYAAAGLLRLSHLGGTPTDDRPLDMSYATLRSVSPLHVEYLKNMGVRASMSISLVQNNQLWGLIACHHYDARYVPYEVRSVGEFIAQMLSLQLASKADSEQHEHEAHVQATNTRLFDLMSREENFLAGLINHSPNVLDLVDAAGAALCFEGHVHTVGAVPPEQEIRALAEWLSHSIPETVFATDQLGKHYADAETIRLVSSGLLAIAISKAQGDYVLWFRPEVVQTVTWGGDPNKPMMAEPDSVRLSPRKSFAAWKEIVRGKSLPWQHYEIEAATELRNTMIDIVLRISGELKLKADILARLNQELERSNSELDSFAYIASHDLKEPLRGIHNYASFLLEDYGDKFDADGREKLVTLVRLSNRLEELINSLLHFSRVGRVELAMIDTDMNHILEETLEILEPRIRELGVEIRIPAPLPSLLCDHVRVREVFNNLITNAMKYNDKPAKWIEIGAEDQDGSVCFYVRDNGIGIPEKHHETIFRIFKRLHARDRFGGGTGAGLTIARKIVERHGGKLWLSSEVGIGTTFYFTLQ